MRYVKIENIETPKGYIVCEITMIDSGGLNAVIRMLPSELRELRDKLNKLDI